MESTLPRQVALNVRGGEEEGRGAGNRKVQPASERDSFLCQSAAEKQKRKRYVDDRAANLRRLAKWEEEGVRAQVVLEPNPEALNMPVSSSAEASAPQPRT